MNWSTKTTKTEKTIIALVFQHGWCFDQVNWLRFALQKNPVTLRRLNNLVQSGYTPEENKQLLAALGVAQGVPVKNATILDFISVGRRVLKCVDALVSARKSGVVAQKTDYPSGRGDNIMAKDIPSWQRTEPMTIDEARTRTRNYLRNSTTCCYWGEGQSHGSSYICPVHTPEWIESQAQSRMEAANQWMGWTNRMGDLVRGQSAVRTGRMLADLGYRDESGHPSAEAIDADLAAWTEHHGYPVALWHVDQVRETLAAAA